MIEKIKFTFCLQSKWGQPRRDRFTSQQLDLLLDRFPELNDCEKAGAGVLKYEGDYKSKLSSDIIQFVKEMGKEVRFTHEGYDSSSEPVRIDGLRYFSEAEYEGASFFQGKSEIELNLLDHLEIMKRSELVFKSQRFSDKPEIGIITAQKQRVLCNQEMAALLNKQNFVGLNLVKEQLTGKYAASNPLFSLQSKTVCGLMLTPLVGRRGSELEELPKNGGVFMSDKFYPKLIKYPESALSSLKGNDIILTSEAIGDVPDEQAEYSHLYKFQQLICSQRFRKWCIKNNLPLSFVPVQFGDALETADVTAELPRMVSHEERVAFTNSIDEKIGHDDTRIGELTEVERSIYCLERLSEQSNLSGMDKFFGSSTGPLYLPVMEGLRLIGATEMIKSLEASKNFFLGDIEPTEENILDQELEINVKLDAHWEEADAFFSHSAESDFHYKLKAYEDNLIMQAR